MNISFIMENMNDALITDGKSYEQVKNQICNDFETNGWTIAEQILDEALDKIAVAQAKKLMDSLKCDGVFQVEKTIHGYRVMVKIPPETYYHYGSAFVDLKKAD